MKKSKLEQVVAELKKDALEHGAKIVYKAQGISMWPLIKMGDKLTLKKVKVEEIKTGDIVIWDTLKNTMDAAIVHRVIIKKKTSEGCRYLTKGDFNLAPDSQWVNYENIIGKVENIKRGKFNLDIGSSTGELISIVYCFISFIFAVVLYAVNAIVRYFSVLYPAKKPEILMGNVLLSVAMGITVREWSECISWTRTKIGTNNCGVEERIADAQLAAGGFSEEAAYLIREGIKVDRIDLKEEKTVYVEKYDCIIFARLVNIIKHDKHTAYYLDNLSKSLKPGGRIILTWLNYHENMINKARKYIWSYLLGRRYSGPAINEVVVGKYIVRLNMELKDVESKIMAEGIRIIDRMKRGNLRALELERSI